MAIFVGKILHIFEELDSTNRYAQQLLLQGEVVEGTVIQAFSQTAGRGQMGSFWWSAKGENLTFSVVLRPHFLAINQQFSLNQAVALAIHDFLKTFIGTGLRIKWSNDILVNEKKICGILVENSLQNNQIASSIVGIGLNINQLNFENLSTATSLAAICGQKYDLNDLRTELLDCLEARYFQLRAGRIKQLQKDYLAVLYRYGEDACYEKTATNAVFWGRIVGIAADGKLEIMHQDGIEAFGLKEIKFL